MRRFHKWLIVILMLGMITTVTSTAFGAPIVYYTTSGSSGNWTLDFSVTNTLGVNNMDIYFFGVLDPSGTINGSPTGWSTNSSFSPNSYGGSSTIYNDVWIDYFSIPGWIANGATTSGFDVFDPSVAAPTSVQWFAFAYDWTRAGATYNGTDYFFVTGNPGFEGTATGGESGESAVPEPSTFLLFGVGLAGVGMLRRRFKN